MHLLPQRHLHSLDDVYELSLGACFEPSANTFSFLHGVSSVFLSHLGFVLNTTKITGPYTS